MSSSILGAAHEVRVTFTQEHFDRFAHLSGDDNPIHVDLEYAARTHFGRTVAHGMMLFGVLLATTHRWLDTPLMLHTQDLMFTAPTYAGDEYRVRLEVREEQSRKMRIGQSIIDAAGLETVHGEAVLGSGPTMPELVGPPHPTSDAAEYRGLRLGMRAETSRSFTADDIEAFCDLVDDRTPRYLRDQEVPPPLLGGIVSYLLGVELPGPGTNWLKQHYRFSGPVAAGRTIATGVEIVRFRPEKQLVNLASSAVVGSIPVLTGRSLVFTPDVESRD